MEAAIDKITTVSVVHLVWFPYGLDIFKSFIDSYMRFDSGHDHQLVLLFNGVKNESDTAPYHDHMKMLGIKYQSFYKTQGFDLDAYFWAASRLNTDYILFLNSYSRMLESEWLSKYMNVIKEKGIGAVSATGSWMSYYSMINDDHSWKWSRNLTWFGNYRKYKLLIKNLVLYRFYFKPFPNPHLRTNAFMINRQLFLSLQFTIPKKKIDAYIFESGRRGLTAQLQKRGLAVLVIDKYGKPHQQDKWYDSVTFWSDEQVNLLISDNQTKKFIEGTKKEKQELTFKAWRRHE